MTMVIDSVIGTILGGAIGDGWGRPHEGDVPQAPVPAPDALIVTDDTQFTVATCEAILECGRADPERIAARFVAWFRAGRLTGLGASTFKALRDLDAGAHWALSGAKGDRSAGNGAAMRIAPLAFVLDPAAPDQRRTLRDICRITHHHDEAYVGALAVARAIRLASRSDYAAENLLTDVARDLPDSQVRDRIVRFSGFGRDVTPFQIGDTWGSSGFVADSVPLAIFAAREICGRPFAEVVQRAVEAGGDADTIGSMTGQIAGARVGFSGLPSELLTRVRDGNEIEAIARKFGTFAAIVDAGALADAR